MQPLTEKQTQQVWSRVMNAQAAPAAAAAQTEPEAQPDLELTPSQLLSCIRHEHSDCALYLHLAGRLKGNAQALLRQLARQEACHARRLSAIYYVKTGEKACPGAPERPCTACINETLRQRYTAELSASERYQALAENAGSYECLLRQMAQEECEHAQKLLCILQQCL